MASNKRKVPEVNSSSQADIAFSLLIFFLVATTMNTDTGLARMLPPMPPENQVQDDQIPNAYQPLNQITMFFVQLHNNALKLYKYKHYFRAKK